MSYYKKSNPITNSLKYAFLFIAIFWIVELIQSIGFDLVPYGIYPRQTVGLVGILTSPFIHGDVQHLMSNSIPFFILSFLLFFFYKKKAIGYLSLIWITSGLFTWIIGRESWHIGASGVIYGMITFLVLGGILSRKWWLILVSIVVSILYSGIIWGIFPGEAGISWEGHLSGAVSGIIWAVLNKKSLRSAQI